MIGLGMTKALAFLGRVPRPLWYLLAAALLVLALWKWGNHREAQGRADERDLWKDHIELVRAERDEAMRKAAERDGEIAAEGETSIAERRKELDDAKADLPDQGLTDRQRARACAELRRQGRGC